MESPSGFEPKVSDYKKAPVMSKKIVFINLYLLNERPTQSVTASSKIFIAQF